MFICTLGGEELPSVLVGFFFPFFFRFQESLHASEILHCFSLLCCVQSLFNVRTLITQSMHYREIKRLRRQKRKLREHATIKGDECRETSELTRQEDLFRLGHIKSRGQLEEVERGEMETPEDGKEEEEIESESEDEEMEGVVSCLETRHYL